jgi:hypothetical protein
MYIRTIVIWDGTLWFWRVIKTIMTDYIRTWCYTYGFWLCLCSGARSCWRHCSIAASSTSPLTKWPGANKFEGSVVIRLKWRNLPRQNQGESAIVIWDGALWFWSVIKTIMTDWLRAQKYHKQQTKVASINASHMTDKDQLYMHVDTRWQVICKFWHWTWYDMQCIRASVFKIYSRCVHTVFCHLQRDNLLYYT